MSVSKASYEPCAKEGISRGFPGAGSVELSRGPRRTWKIKAGDIFHASAKKRVLSNYQKRSAELEEEEEEVYREYPATPQSYLRESVS